MSSHASRPILIEFPGLVIVSFLLGPAARAVSSHSSSSFLEIADTKLGVKLGVSLTARPDLQAAALV